MFWWEILALLLSQLFWSLNFEDTFSERKGVILESVSLLVLMSRRKALQTLFLQKLFLLLLIPFLSLISELFLVGLQFCNQHFCFSLWYTHFCFYLLGFVLHSIVHVVAQLLPNLLSLSVFLIFFPYSVLCVHTSLCIHTLVPGIDKTFFLALW